MSNQQPNIGRRVDQLRREKRVSKARLARQTGMHQEAVGRILRGGINHPSPDIILRLLGALGYSLEDEAIYDIFEECGYTLPELLSMGVLTFPVNESDMRAAYDQLIMSISRTVSDLLKVGHFAGRDDDERLDQVEHHLAKAMRLLRQ